MCGIVGYVGDKQATPILLEGLKQLEYRGYDSAGLAIVNNGNIQEIKSVGKVISLEEKINQKNLQGTIGIAHTRWATHGKPSDKNSHPHSDCDNNIWVVHNGIVENEQELRKFLLEKKHNFTSDTDSEIIAHLIEEFNKVADFKTAIIETLKIIKGTYGLAIINKNEPDKIIIARMGSPLVLGVGKNEFIIASDTAAIVRHTNNVIYLEDGEIGIITKNDYEIINLRSQNIDKKITKLDQIIEQAQKGNYEHFMLKEIFEQPDVVRTTIKGRLLPEDGLANLGGLRDVTDDLAEIKKIIIVSCGTSYYAGLIGKYMIEEYARVSVEVEHASEFRYRKSILDKKTAVLAISQSGETADTLAAIKEVKNKNILTLGIVNVVGSTIAREVDAGVYTHAGQEIGVASTKAFVSQVSVLALITLLLGRQRDMSCVTGQRIATELNKIPHLIELILKDKDIIKKIAQKYKNYTSIFYLGRKYNTPIAYEGALKLKEISYIHAEGYPTGEMKHGPLALIDKNFPSLVVAPEDSVYEKNFSGIQEIKARSGKVLAVATKGNKELLKIADDVIFIPKTLEMLTPLLSVIPLQLFAYYIATKNGCDVDKPRNLAKSVTVE